MTRLPATLILALPLIPGEDAAALQQPGLARYNSPFTPWFLRHNEIMIEVEHHALERVGIIAADTSTRL